MATSQPFIDLRLGNDEDLLADLLSFAAAMDQPMYSAPANYAISYLVPAIAIVLFWMARQATPGKMLLGMKIADAQTLGPPTRKQDIGRYLAYYVSILCLMLGFLWVAFDPRKQGWHDKLAGTVVIRREFLIFAARAPACSPRCWRCRCSRAMTPRRRARHL